MWVMKSHEIAYLEMNIHLSAGCEKNGIRFLINDQVRPLQN